MSHAKQLQNRRYFVASFLPYDQFILSMDRTNGMLGSFSIHFLVWSIVHQGTAQSVFCNGFDLIRIVLFNPQDKQEELRAVTRLFSNALMGPKHHIYQLYPLC